RPSARATPASHGHPEGCPRVVSPRYAPGPGQRLPAQPCRMAGTQARRTEPDREAAAAVAARSPVPLSAERRTGGTGLGRRRLPEDRGARRRPHAGDPAPAYARIADCPWSARFTLGGADPPRCVALAGGLRAAAGAGAHFVADSPDEEPVGQPRYARSHQSRPGAGAGAAGGAALCAGARTLPSQGAQPFTAFLGTGGKPVPRLARTARLAAPARRDPQGRTRSADRGRGRLRQG